MTTKMGAEQGTRLARSAELHIAAKLDKGRIYDEELHDASPTAQPALGGA